MAKRAELSTEGDVEVRSDDVSPSGADQERDAVVQDEADDGRASGRRGSPRGETVSISGADLMRQARRGVVSGIVGVAIGILGLSLAVFFYFSAADARAAEGTRQDVLEAGRLMGLRTTTFEGASIEQWVADTQALATPTYADEVAQTFGPEILDGLRANNVQSVGQITSSFVQDVQGDTATVFLVIRQTYTAAALDRQVSDELRMDVSLQRVDGEWLVSDAAVLGPSTLTQVADPAAPVDPAAPDESTDDSE